MRASLYCYSLFPEVNEGPDKEMTMASQTTEYTRRKPCCSKARHRFIRAWWGCKENPGTWDNGNGALVFLDVCLHCGCQRREVRSYCGRTDDNVLTYSQPDAELAREARERRQ
jgi:hypothetical protein